MKKKRSLSSNSSLDTIPGLLDRGASAASDAELCDSGGFQLGITKT